MIEVPPQTSVEIQQLASRLETMKNTLLSQQEAIAAAREERLGLLQSMLPPSVAQRISSGDVRSLDQAPAATVVVVVVLGLADMVRASSGSADRELVDELLGELDNKLNRAYDLALEIKAMVVKEAVPGANGKDLYAKAYDMAQQKGFGDAFMGYENPISFIAHGVGIELDELPVIAKNFDMPLEAGMVFALEPKFIFPEIGAVGIEDTLTVTENGLEQISYFDESIQAL